MDFIEEYFPALLTLLTALAAVYIGFKAIRAFIRVRGLSGHPSSPITHFTTIDREPNPFDFTGIGRVGSLYNSYDENNPFSPFYKSDHHSPFHWDGK